MTEKLFKKMKNRNDGAALPSVIIVTAILVFMIISMTSLSVQQLQVSKHHKNIDYAYIGSDSFVERIISYIKGYIDDPAKDYMSVGYMDDKQYAEDVVNIKIRNEVLDGPYGINTNPDLRNVDVSIGGNSAVSSVEKIEFVSYTTNLNSLFVKIGITVNTAYSRGINSTSNSKVYAIKEFEIERPKRMGMKPAALNGIGDVFAKDYITADIKGDIKVFGTGPEKAKQPEQYYYGGVYARSNADIFVDGSIFTRSFIRAGRYDDGTEDNGSITVKKDAVAQCIQVFGNNDRVLVCKDAFTFDDLEMNGLNSVIAVNRNFFGLSHGDEPDENGNTPKGSYHDASSGIVNSSVVHHPDAIDDAMKSKIVINGDVFINGGSFRIDPVSGDVMYSDKKDEFDNTIPYTGSPQIEDASTAWDDDVPTYKNFDYENDPPYQGNIEDRYKDWIYTQMPDHAVGYGNVFQKWPPQADPETWLNTNLSSILVTGVPSGVDNPAKISGLCMYEIAANEKMYFMYKVSDSLPNETRTPQEASQISPARYVLQSETEYNDALNYLEPSERAPDWKTEWDVAVNAGTDDDWEVYFTKSRDTLKALRTPLIAVTADFFKRAYHWDNAEIVNTPINDSNTGESKFKYIGDELANIDNTNGSYVITSSELDTEVAAAGFKDPATNNYFISKYIDTLDSRYSSPDPDNAYYYIVVNTDPDKTLVIDSRMNGIVYSAGKVVMTRDAYLKGFMIAAGQGYYNEKGENQIVGSAADPSYLPKVSDGNSLTRLDNGDFACVEFRGEGNQTDKGTATIDFSDGLDALMTKFDAQGMKVALQRLFNNP